MRLRSPFVFLAGSATVFLLAALQDPTPAAPTQAQMQEMMAKAKKFTEPGPMHKRLGAFLGTWTTETRFVMGGKKAAPELGESVGSWSVAGRWLELKATGKLMNRAYASHTLLGFDNFKQSFVMTVVNNVDTAMLRSEGDVTQDGKTMILYGTLDEYLTGEHDKMVKYVFRFPTDDKIVLEVHDLPIGEANTMVIEITYQRKA